MPTTQTLPEYLVGSVSGTIHSQDMPWISQPGIEGSEIKLLRTIPETGGHGLPAAGPAGSEGPDAQALRVGRVLRAAGTVTFGTNASRPGSYAYELGGFRHIEDAPEEEIVMLFITHGPLQVINEDGSKGPVVDTDADRPRGRAPQAAILADRS